MKKIYIIGPTLGMDRLNIDAFVQVQEELSEKGVKVIIPHDLFTSADQRALSLDEAEQRRVETVLAAQEVRYLYGWYNDRFAQSEMLAAKNANVLIRPYFQTHTSPTT